MLKHLSSEYDKALALALRSSSKVPRNLLLTFTKNLFPVLKTALDTVASSTVHGEASENVCWMLLLELMLLSFTILLKVAFSSSVGAF